MQRDLNLSENQARARAAVEVDAALTERRLREELRESFAGAWLTEGEFLVAVTDPTTLGVVRATGARALVVRHSEKRLTAVKDRLDAAVSPQEVHGWYVDVVTNSVVVLARDPDSAAVRDFARSAGDPSVVRVERSDEQPRLLHDVRGGDAYYYPESLSWRCSVGFAVQGGYVTAGHCGGTGTATYGVNKTAQGRVEAASFPDNDYGWVKTNADWTPTASVNDYSGAVVPVGGSIEAVIGASVCRSGSTTQWRCGVLQAKNQTVRYVDVPDPLHGLTRTSACAEGGDSGGPFLNGDQAQGVTSGASGDCTRGGTTYFQPVNEVLQAYGLSLVVDPHAPSSTAASGVTGDFTGDGKADVITLYDYDNSTSGLWVVPGTQATGESATTPFLTWKSDAGAWNWAKTKLTVGDFTGDGKADVLVLYDHGGGITGLWVFPGTTGTSAPYRVWQGTAAGGWDWSHLKLTAGDFTGDPKADALVLVDHGGATTSLWVFPGATATPRQVWRSAAGTWDWNRTKISAGDFNGDGKADVTALHEDAVTTTSLWIFPGAPATTTPYRVYLSGVGHWAAQHTKISAGDFNGDGKADVTALYNYGAGASGLWVFPGTASRGDAASVPRRVWMDTTNGWEWHNMRTVSGDFTGDGKADVATLWNYGNYTTGLWILRGSAATGDTATRPDVVWKSGVRHWNWYKSRLG